MGKFVFKNAFVSVETGASGSTTQSSLHTYTKSLTLNYSRAEVDSTCMGDIGIARLIGLRDWSLDLEFAQDFGTGLLDSLLYGMMTTTKASLTVIVRPDTGSVGTGNTNYIGEGLIFEYTPASGGVGDLATASASIRCAGGSSTASSWLRRTTAAA
jgi:hypothetical protein